MKSKTNIGHLLLAGYLVVACLTQFATAQAWTPAGPISRSGHSAILDLNTNRMVVFGGDVSPANLPPGQYQDLNDVWRLSKSLTWTSVKASGTPPAPRVDHSAVYDPASNRMIVFGGGLGNASPCANDVWVLTNANGEGGKSAWVQLNPSGGAPSQRLRHTAVYDPNTNTMMVFGGNNCFSTNFGDVWVLSDANGVSGTPTWTQLSPAGTSPGTSEDHTAVYDPGSNTMTVFGGTLGGSNSNEVWVLSNANGTGGTPTWTQLSPAGTLPPGRNLASAVYDAINNRMTVFGGNNSTSIFGDTWVLSNANGLGGAPAWTQLGPVGDFAEARTSFSAVYNPSTNKMTVFGGALNYQIGLFTNDVWTLSHANGK